MQHLGRLIAMIRDPLPSDQGYIAATWARSMLSGMRAGHAMRRHGPRERRPNMSEREVRRQIGAQIDAVLDRPDTRGLVSVRDADPNYIIGWVLYVAGPAVPMVHYLYVRDHDADGLRLRGRGVARSLLQRIGVDHGKAVVCTSDGPDSDALRRRYRASVHVPLEEFLK